MLGADEPFWLGAARSAWALRWSRMALARMNAALGLGLVYSLAWLCGFGLGAWEAQTRLANLWAALGGVGALALTAAWCSAMHDCAWGSDEGREVGRRGALLALSLGLGAWAGQAKGFSLAWMLGWWALFAAGSLAEAALRRKFFDPLRAWCLRDLENARQQWEERMLDQGFEGHWLSESQEARGSSSRWRPDEVESLTLRAPLISLGQRSRLRALSPPGASRFFKQADALRRRGWIQWAPSGLARMGASELEELARQWMPVALSVAKDRFELERTAKEVSKAQSTRRL